MRNKNPYCSSDFPARSEKKMTLRTHPTRHAKQITDRKGMVRS